MCVWLKQDEINKGNASPLVLDAKELVSDYEAAVSDVGMKNWI